MKKMANKAFTLIELLVVITIIGILATGAVTVFTSQIQKARDTTRTNDIKALQTAVEQSYQDAAAYPGTGSTATDLVDAVDSYIELIPEDPKHNQDCQGARCTYAYTVGPDGGIANGVYELSTAFEADGSIDARAGSGSDNGQDDARFEVGITVDSLQTNIPSGTSAASCGNHTNGALMLSKACN